MNTSPFSALDLGLCRARIILSIVALLSMYIDPTVGGFLGIDSYAFLTGFSYFLYSLAIYFAVRQGAIQRQRLWATVVLDITFATILARLTEDQTSPSFVLFLFAVIAVGCWSDLKGTIAATLICASMYLLAIAFGTRRLTNFHLMRAGYFAVAGYVTIFFGQQRSNFEKRLHDLESAAERQNIARSLHDGYIQSLAGVNLRLESCRDMLMSQQAHEALTEITELQRHIDREYDEVRAYVRSLANIDPALSSATFHGFKTEVNFHAEFAARGLIVEQVLLIALEGLRNTRRHGRARRATIDIRHGKRTIQMIIEDDGVGFKASAGPPWTIASRVAEFGGRMTIDPERPFGAYLKIEMPDD